MRWILRCELVVAHDQDVSALNVCIGIRYMSMNVESEITDFYRLLLVYEVKVLM